MKILLVSALPPPAGGIATWTERYLRYCRKRHIDISLVNIAVNGDRAVKINNRTNYLDELSRTKRIIKDMRSMLRSAKPSVVHINTSCASLGIFRDLLCVKEAKRAKVPIILHFHCDVASRIHGAARMFALKKMAGMSDKLLVLNSSSKEFVFSHSKIDPIVMPNFVDADYFSEQHEIKDRIREVVFVGHVQNAKGCREILGAAEKLPSIHFTLIGPVADEISMLACPANVSMVGAKTPEEVKSHLQNSDLYLFPSYAEGFSLSLTEAMASGLPVVATEVGANRDMIEDRGGILIPVMDENAIVSAIEEISSADKRKEMSSWNTEKAKSFYLTETVMSSLLEIYQGMMRRGHFS